MIDIFAGEVYEKLTAPKEIDNCLKIALEFYKDYNQGYYQMIIDGLESGKIVISDSIKKSYVDTNTGVAYISLLKNDSDLFGIVHEFAHFIDRNSKIPIVPDNLWFFSETFSFYMEKQFEAWLPEEKYGKLISVRRNNRMYFEGKMVSVIRDQLYYEKLYIQNGFIREEKISIDRIRNIMRYPYPNLVNYLLTYPVANILSSYLLGSGPLEDDHQICDMCLAIDWYKLLPKIKKMSKNI